MNTSIMTTKLRAMGVGLLIGFVLTGGMTFASVGAFAQAQKGEQKGTPGTTRVQGQELLDPAAPAPTRTTGTLIDYREQMRRFVQAASVYARATKRDFAIIAEGGLELLAKADESDETKLLAARAFLRAVDGILVEALYYGDPRPGEPTVKERLDRKLRLLEFARQSRLKVWVADRIKDSAQASDSIKRSAERGFIPFPIESRIPEINALPRFAPRPYQENPKSVVSMTDVRNFLLLGDSQPFGREDEFAMKMHDTNYDVIVTDVFHGRTPLSRRAVETLKFKKLGAKRLVFARLDMTSAATYSWFWKPEWREGSPAFIAAPQADNPDRHWIEYWRPDWQAIVYGDANSYLYGIIAQGFDGVILAGLDAYRFFEGGSEQDQQAQ